MEYSTLEKIYAGFLGKCFGVRLGAPVEPQIWTHTKIREIYGNIDNYTKYYKTFAADDDTNGPVFFHRQLLDKKNPEDMSADDVAKAWLNFGRENIGMFWWGGDGISTEHTAYLNLLKGIEPPKSGSIEQNGKELAEQIGGQIFIDTWGLLFPNNPEKAASHAKLAASVSHDGDGLEGAKFIAACISLAFGKEDITEIIEDALKFVDQKSTYFKVVKAVIEFHKEHPTDWYECREYLENEWGYDKYGGVVHIIPNAGVCVLALLYGEGNYTRTIEIATMCGWDTDCNAGNVGTILGVMTGLTGLPDKYRKVTNDMIITSSVVGQMNIVDIPTFVKETARLSCKLNKEEIPEFLTYPSRLGEINYDFSLPGSTHGFVSDNYFKTELSHVRIPSQNKDALGILIDRMVDTDKSHIFNKTYYRRDDFSDERYKPCFSPQAYSGQRVEMSLFFEKWQGEDAFVRPYIRDTFTRARIYLDYVKLSEDNWTEIDFVIPDLEGSFADEIGIELSTNSPLSNRLFGRVDLGLFKITGMPAYSIDFKKQSVEFLNVTPFSHNNGKRTIITDESSNTSAMQLSSTEGSLSFSGSYYDKDITICCKYNPESGNQHKIIFKAKGIRQYYSVGFDESNSVSLNKRDFDSHELLEKVNYEWRQDKTYELKLIVAKNNCKLSIDGNQVISCDKIDSEIHGMFGFEIGNIGKANVSDIKINL